MGIRNPVTSRSATKASEERAPRVGIDDCGGRDHTTALASPFHAGGEHPIMPKSFLANVAGNRVCQRILVHEKEEGHAKYLTKIICDLKESPKS